MLHRDIVSTVPVPPVPRRVLVLTLWFPNSASPGLGAFVHQQAVALRDAGLDVRVIQPIPFTPTPLPWLRARWNGWSHVPRNEIRDGFRVDHPRFLALPRHLLHHRVGAWMAQGIGAAVRRLHDEWPFDLIHAHTTYPCGAAANQLRDQFFPGVKVIHTIHRTCIVDSPQWSKRARAAVCRALDGCDHAIFVSRDGYDLAHGYTAGRIAARASIVSNGVDPRQFDVDAATAAAALELRRQHRDTFNLLFVGFLCERKGVPELLEAVARLGEPGGRRLRLFLVGRDEMGGQLTALLRRHGIADRVTLVGELPHAQVKKWMSFADAFILPSRSEGVPTVMFEALYVGTPAIFTRVGGTPDIVHDGREALLVEPGAADAIAHAIRRLMVDRSLREELARNGRELVARHYTWAINASDIRSIYEQVLSTPARSACNGAQRSAVNPRSSEESAESESLPSRTM